MSRTAPSPESSLRSIHLAGLQPTDLRIQSRAWIVPLQPWLPELRRLQAGLLPEERGHAASLRIQRMQDAFVVRRALLRELLSIWIGDRVRRMRWDYGVWGKPCLPPEVPDALHFNVSCRDSLAMIASSRHPIGVDVERIAPIAEREAIVRRCAAPKERERLLESDDDTLDLFYRWWACKEACVKAWGCGLDCDLREIALPAVVLDSSDTGPVDATAWGGPLVVQGFDVIPGYAVAVATSRDAAPVALEWLLPEELRRGNGFEHG